MTRRNPVLDELHAFRERLGRSHGFDAERIAATLREHEHERKTAARRRPAATRNPARGTRAAQQAAAPDGHASRTVSGRR